MATNPVNEAVEILQELGLKEYEAKSFVALSRMQSGTAKEISNNSDVPRTRVYDAIRVLEAKGLVETQHTNPQQFRAVTLDEAIGIFQNQYESKTETLERALERLDPVESEGDRSSHEVWSLSNWNAIQARIESLIDGGEREVVVVVGDNESLESDIFDAMEDAVDRGLDVVVGVEDSESMAALTDRLPGANVFVSELDWLQGGESDPVEVEFLLLVDREAILVSTASDDGAKGQAVFGRGFSNGLVVITRRMMSSGLLQKEDPSNT